MGFIDEEQLLKLAAPLIKSGYGEYLNQLPRLMEPSFDEI
jgi:hypothetical protein